MTSFLENRARSHPPRDLIFSPYPGTQFDLQRIPTPLRSPFQPVDPPLYSPVYIRPTARTIFDVRNTYSTDHVLRQSDSERALCARQQEDHLRVLEREKLVEARARQVHARKMLEKQIREEIESEMKMQQGNVVYGKWVFAVAFLVFLGLWYYWAKGCCWGVWYGMLIVWGFPRIVECLKEETTQKKKIIQKKDDNRVVAVRRTRQ